MAAAALTDESKSEDLSAAEGRLFGAAFLQTEAEIWPELTVSSKLRFTAVCLHTCLKHLHAEKLK